MAILAGTMARKLSDDSYVWDVGVRVGDIASNNIMLFHMANQQAAQRLADFIQLMYQEGNILSTES